MVESIVVDKCWLLLQSLSFNKLLRKEMTCYNMGIGCLEIACLKGNKNDRDRGVRVRSKTTYIFENIFF